MSLSVSTQAPDFSLPSTSGDTFTLSKLKGTPIILFFYPRDFTPGCTKEVCSFRDNFSEFKSVDIPVFGISTDSLESHHRFIKEHALPFHLLSDADGIVSKLYKARMPFMNISKRVTYLLDKDHRIVAVHDNLFGAENHVITMMDKLTQG